MLTQHLLSRLRTSDRRWEAAMKHPGYRDEPTEERPFTEAEVLRYKWADAWRNAYHLYEEALYRQPDVRAGMIEGLTLREPLTIYESA